MDITFATQHSRDAASSILTDKVRRHGGANNGKSGTDHNVRLLNVAASPQEGMIFHCAGRLGFRWMAGVRGFACSTSSYVRQLA
jgi:hypothetical protein